MNLDNRAVLITALSSTTFPPETNVEVKVTEEVIPGIHKVIGLFNLNFLEVYSSLEDAALLSAVHDKLMLIPD